MMDHKTATKKFYDDYANQFQDRTYNYLREHIWDDASLFVSNLQGRDVLDIGSGSGRDSAFFQERGLNPLCIDISPEMVRLCKERGLQAQVGDLEELNFGAETFDGVWAYTSLLHMPKQKLPTTLANISRILKPKGIFYMGMKKGDFEGLLESDKYPGCKRFFSLYSDSELRGALEPHFEIFHTSVVSLGDATFLNYLTRKKAEKKARR